MPMQMSAHIRDRIQVNTWTPLLVYLHGPDVSHLQALSKMATELLTTDINNYSMQTTASSLSVLLGTEVFVVPSFDLEYVKLGCVVSPAYSTMVWEQTPKGDQFFVMIPDSVAENSSLQNIRIKVRFYIKTVLIGELVQIVNKNEEINMMSTLPIETDATDAKSNVATVKQSTFFASVFVVLNDENEDDKKAWDSLRKNITGGPLLSVRTYQHDSDTDVNEMLLKKADVIQVCLSQALFHSADALADIEKARILGKSIKCVYWSNDGSPEIPDSLSYLRSSVSFFPLETISFASKLEDLERKMYLTTKNTLKAMSAENNFPFYSFVLTKKPVSKVDENASSHTDTSGNIAGGSKWLKSLLTKGKNVLTALTSTMEAAKQKIEDAGLKTVYVGYMCEDPACASSRSAGSDRCGHFVHEPFEIKVASDLLVRAAPYLKMMRYLLKAGQVASTLAGFPIPVAIPAIPEMLDAEFVAGVDTALELSDMVSAEETLDSKISSAEDDTPSGDFVGMDRAGREHAKKWKLLMEKHVGRDWIERTNLRQAIVASNGNVRWVCDSCYADRWHALCEQSDSPSDSALSDTLSQNTDTSCGGPENGAVSMDAELWDFLSSLPRVKQRNRMQETRNLEEFVTKLQREGVDSLQKLMFVDALWGVDDDLGAVRTILTGPSIGFSNTQASVVIKMISEVRWGGNLTSPDFGCRDLVLAFAQKYLDEGNGTILSNTSTTAASYSLGPVNVERMRVKALLDMLYAR